VKELCEEKNKLNKKYNSLLDDVKKCMNVTEKQVLEHGKLMENMKDPKLGHC
jgi:hypothetical protein